MLSALYTTSIRLYQATLRAAALFHPKARLAIQGRNGWLQQINAKLADNSAPIAWFHAASLGEFEQGRPVMEVFRQQYPGYKILLTFFSPSGYEVRKNYAGADYIFYLPFDTPANARQFIERVKPVVAFFIKYEFWYHYLRELHARHIPILSFSAIFRPDQIFFKPYGGFYRGFLRFFDHILVQNQESVDLLKSIGIKKVTLAGDTRFDRVKQVAEAKKDIPIARHFKAGKPLLVVGSAWQADMDVLIPFLKQFDQPLKVIIAPHEIHDDEIERWRSQLPGQTVRFSEAVNHPTLKPFNHLIIDNIGMLSSLYQYGEFAYIGGAFGKGLHNILEAATFRVPLFFGPNYGKFQEAVDLVKAGAAFPVSDSAQLNTVFRRIYEDPSQASAIAGDYVTLNTGATSKVMKIVKDTVVSRS
ncbi:3-deoxy-D-manno-octulosonic acid transferase [Larkinella terrae]|uniref:3-deoxy-D-manno-octulosonic acid transferase n=1 Tax=Larkinella terrae TaxID=2025311 RepID=A0A7K0ERJ3_9BACT|nr:glycosyltransferase N-terminal domain-containing protein [Larkinella terrae]MRS64414.1 3-deoxy-D-manno-octulosonic acid transferase [Larkinella terrae]